MAKFIQKGDVIDYVAGANIALGSVVPLVTRIGVATETISNGATGPVTLVGVIEEVAVNDAAFAVGDQLYWDNATKKLTKVAAGNTPAGIATEPKVLAGTTARVKIG